MKVLLLPIFALLLSLTSLPAEEKQPSLDDLFKQLEVAVKAASAKAATDAKKSPDDPRSRESQYYLAQLSTNLRRSLSNRRELSSLQESLAQMQAMIPSEDVQRLSEQIIARLQEENAAQDKEFITTTDQKVAGAIELALAATEAKELDGTIAELSNLSPRSSSYGTSEATNRSREQARSAVTFLCRWQDYLMQKKNGNVSAAQEVLKSLSQNTAQYPFVPRSAILDRMGPAVARKGEEIVVLPDLKGKTIADLDALIVEAYAFKDRNPGSQQASQRLSALERLRDAAQQADAGIYGAAFSAATDRFSNSPATELLPLQQALLLKILPGYLEIEKTYPVKDGETPVSYLQRVTAEAKAKSDWRSAWKALEGYRLVAFSSGQAPSFLQGDIQALSQFIIAQNNESAGLYTEAVRAYKRVISQPGDNLPVAEAQLRLEAIRKDHPDDYEAANKPTEIRTPASGMPPGMPR